MSNDYDLYLRENLFSPRKKKPHPLQDAATQ